MATKTKKTAAKKRTSSKKKSTGLKKGLHFDKWVVMVILVLVGVVGGFFVYRSFASSNAQYAAAYRPHAGCNAFQTRYSGAGKNFNITTCATRTINGNQVIFDLPVVHGGVYEVCMWGKARETTRYKFDVYTNDGSGWRDFGNIGPYAISGSGSQSYFDRLGDSNLGCATYRKDNNHAIKLQGRVEAGGHIYFNNIHVKRR